MKILPIVRSIGSLWFVVALAVAPAEAEPICGDVNQTDTVTTADALQVLRFSVGQPVELSCPDFLVRYGFDTDRGFTSLWSPDYLFGVRVSVATSVTVTHLGMYGREVEANVKMALYSDSAGEPDDLLASTNPHPLAIGGQDIPVTEATPISPGFYWIMAVLDAETNIGGNDNAPPGNFARYRDLAFAGPLPESFGEATPYDETTLDFWMKVIQ